MPKHMPLSPSLRLVYAVLGIFLVIMGLVGLLVPVIPGVIFLAAAVYVFSRVSRRFHLWSHSRPTLRKMHYRMEQMRMVNFGQRLRMVGLMTVGAFVAGIGAATAGVTRLARRLKRTTS